MSKTIRRFSVATSAFLFSVATLVPSTAFAASHTSSDIDENVVLNLPERLDRSVDALPERLDCSVDSLPKRLDRSGDFTNEWIKFSVSERLDRSADSLPERLDRSGDFTNEWIKFSVSERLDRSGDITTEWVKGADLSLSNVLSQGIAKAVSFALSILS